MAKANPDMNNVKRIYNYLESPRPMYVDRTSKGFKLSNLGSNSKEEVQDYIDEFKRELGIECTILKHRGYGPYKWAYYVIVPYSYNETEALSWEFRL